MKFYKITFLQFLSWLERYTKTNMQYLAYGGFWLVSGKIILFVISFILMLAFANWLPRETFGKYQYVINILALLSIFTLPGIHTSIVRSIAQKKEGTLRLAVREKIKWGLLGSIPALGFSIWYFSQENYLLSIAFFLGSIFLPFLETFHIYLRFWNGRKRFDIQIKYEVLSAFLVAIFLLGAIYTKNLIILVSAFLISHTFFSWLFYKRTLCQVTNSQEDLSAISFGKHLTVMSSVAIIASHIDKIIVWMFLGAANVAIYSFAQLPVQKIINAIPISELALPKLGEQKIKENKKNIFQKFLKLFFISLPIALLFIFAGPTIYKIFFPQYTESILYFQMLSVLIAMIPFSLLSSALISDLRQKELYIVSVILPFLKIILFLALTPVYGILGIVISIILSQLLINCLTLFFYCKI